MYFRVIDPRACRESGRLHVPSWVFRHDGEGVGRNRPLAVSHWCTLLAHGLILINFCRANVAQHGQVFDVGT